MPPDKDTFIQLNRGDRVVVAEFAVHPADSVDSIWVKLAHTQDEQGWIREKELKKSLHRLIVFRRLFIFSVIRMPLILWLFSLCS